MQAAATASATSSSTASASSATPASLLNCRWNENDGFVHKHNGSWYVFPSTADTRKLTAWRPVKQVATSPPRRASPPFDAAFVSPTRHANFRVRGHTPHDVPPLMFSRTIPSTAVPRPISLSGEMVSAKHTIPINAVSAALVPAHAAYAVPI